MYTGENSFILKNWYLVLLKKSSFYLCLVCKLDVLICNFGFQLVIFHIFIWATQGIPGVPPIREGYNPATWMLEVSTQACEERLGLDFATVYKNSDQFR